MTPSFMRGSEVRGHGGAVSSYRVGGEVMPHVNFFILGELTNLKCLPQCKNVLILNVNVAYVF